MNFTPKSEDDLKRENLCSPGLQPFTVIAAADAKSTTGKDMIKLKLNVHCDDGFDYDVYDYISPHFMAHKLRHFAVSCGLESNYEAGSLCADDCNGRQGWCDIAHKDDPKYGPKNIVKDYTKGKTLEARTSPTVAPDGAKPAAEDDDVPF